MFLESCSETLLFLLIQFGATSAKMIMQKRAKAWTIVDVVLVLGFWGRQYKSVSPDDCVDEDCREI